MPSVAQESPTMPSSKKRRRDDNHQQISLYASLMAELTSPGTNNTIFSSHSAGNIARGIFAGTAFDHGALFQHSSSPLATRKIIPLPPGKRQRTTVDIDVEADGEPMQRSPSSTPPHQHQHHPSQIPQQEHQQARHTSRGDLDAKTRSPAAPTSASLMSRCHICSRKPNKKSDLDSFADCQGCGQRTCYVCIRECLGWGPHIPSSASTLDPFNLHSTGRTTTTTAIITTPPEEGDASFTMLDADDAPEEDQHPHPHHQPRPQHPPPIEAPGAGTKQHEQGWTKGGGHRQVVCSRCCVEKGADGDVVCLGCLPFVEG